MKISKNTWLWIGLVVFLIAEIWIGFHVEMDMSAIREEPHKIHSLLGWEIPLGGINAKIMLNTWFVMGLVWILAFLATRRLTVIPGAAQSIFELLIGFFDSLCRATLKEKSRAYLPLIVALFLFVCISNWIVVLPFPWIEEPTRALDTTLGLALLCFCTAHISSIRYRGFKHYIREYFEPMIEIRGRKFPNILFMPLNVVGEIGKVVSHSFRLFGNILGGSIIMLVISNIAHYVVLPIGLNLFFGLFVGIIQAFVFSVLALTYIAVLVD